MNFLTTLYMRIRPSWDKSRNKGPVRQLRW